MSLEHPHNFPPIRQAIVPGDRVVIAVGMHVLSYAELIAGILDYLISIDVEPNQICILRTEQDEAREIDFLAKWESTNKDQIEIATHHPTIRDQMAYLAADPEGEPIYFNRQLIDADFIIPLLCAETERADQSESHGLLYPTFTDEKSQQRAAGTAPTKKTSKKTGAKKSTKEETLIVHYESPDTMLGLFLRNSNCSSRR